MASDSWSQCMRKKRKGAFHEPPGESTGPTDCRPGPLTRRPERFMVPMRGHKTVEAFHEPPCSAGVPPASCGGVSPPARTPGGTPGELAGEDACATSAGQFMVPMHSEKRKRAFHEPP